VGFALIVDDLAVLIGLHNT